MLSVIVPIYNEEKYIKQCIDSILSQDYPKDDIEILFVDGMSTDKTRDIVKSYSEKYSFIQLLDNPKQIVPFAMNAGVKASKGDLIMRLDGHALYPANYFSEIVRWHEKLPEVDNIGAICITDVVNKTKTSVAIAKVMSDKFGVGNSSFRTGVDKEYMEVDTVPFGCYKRRVFEKIGLYNERLIRVQDLELNKRLKHAGGKIVIVPSITCTYIPRETYLAFAKNRYMTGLWVIKAAKITGSLRTLGLRHYIPLLFVLSIFVLSVASCFYWFFAILLTLEIVGYLLILFMHSCQITNISTTPFHILRAFCTLHFSYGWGSLNGIVSKVSSQQRV